MTDDELQLEKEIVETQQEILTALEPLNPLQRKRVIRAVLAMHGYPLPPDRELEPGGGQ